jgi:hypothetical protein
MVESETSFTHNFSMFKAPLFFYSSQHRTRRQHHFTTRTILIGRRPFGVLGGPPPQTGSGAEPQRRAMARSVVKLKVSMIWYCTKPKKPKNMNRALGESVGVYTVYRAEHYGTHAGTHKFLFIIFITAPSAHEHRHKS